MKSDVRIEDRVSQKYAQLSTKLRVAADFVVANQMDIATRSLRTVSSTSDVSPAAFSRLARALGFESYEELRESCRNGLWDRGASFAERAERLRSTQTETSSILEQHASACMNNISEMAGTIAPDKLKYAVDVICKADNVILFGAFSSTGIVEYMAYLAQYFSSNWTLAGRMGASLGSAMSDLSENDALLIVTKTPYARRAVVAADMAKQSGTQVILITDSHACPAIRHADSAFIVPSNSPQFFSSYAATIALMETLVAMVVTQSGATATKRIGDVEEKNRKLGEFWTE